MSNLRRRMYTHLVAAANNVITIIDDAVAGNSDARNTLAKIRMLLQRALDEAEELYLSADDAEFEAMLFQEEE